MTLGADERTLFEEQRREEQRMAEVDELNIMYVAFTRAKEQLYIFCPDPADIKNPPEHDRRYPTLLASFAPQGCQRGDTDCRHTGSTEIKGKQVEGLARLSFADWSNHVSIASPSEQALTPLLEDRRRFGIYAHDLLATVQHAGDVEEAIRRFSENRQLSDDETAELGALARKMVGDPLTSRFFSPEYTAKNECDLVADGHRGRPDRVVLTPTETWVVDFKTGTPLNEHRSQVQTYCKALGDMGYPGVKGYLLYVSPEINVVDC